MAQHYHHEPTAELLLWGRSMQPVTEFEPPSEWIDTLMPLQIAPLALAAYKRNHQPDWQTLRDNASVAELGLSHKELASHLQPFVEAARLAHGPHPPDPRNQIRRGRGANMDALFFYDDAEQPVYALLLGLWKADLTLIDLHDGSQIEFSPHTPEHIGREGNYDSRSPIGPQQIATFLGLIKSEQDSKPDPMATLTSGCASDVVLHTNDQVKRFHNLRDVGHPAILAAEVRIELSSVQEVFDFLSAPNNADFIHCLDTTNLVETPPSPLTLHISQLGQMARVLRGLDDSTRQYFLDLVEVIQYPQTYTDLDLYQRDWLEQVMHVSVDFDCTNHQPQPLPELLEKLPPDIPSELFLRALFEAVDGKLTGYDLNAKLHTHNPRMVRQLAAVWGRNLTTHIAPFRPALGLTKQASAEEHIHAFLQRYDDFERASGFYWNRLARSGLNAGLPERFRIITLIDKLRLQHRPDPGQKPTKAKPITQDDRRFLNKHGLPVRDIQRVKAEHDNPYTLEVIDYIRQDRRTRQRTITPQ